MNQLSFGKETSRKENRDLWDSLRECEKELKDTRHLALKEVFAEIEQVGRDNMPENSLYTYCFTKEDFQNLKKKFGVK